ncbi:hypothetical protein EV182_002918 [Spiromyces aspiralis]|uniref:Uncharacterized protein n=1 Tax=Spiromyces aspiralis TaxID=68401 RepID=A0ACC1HTM2_9FUNG|nr:hypothetical protein EV182_002918 [Spiromyces aspiralis]
MPPDRPSPQQFREFPAKRNAIIEKKKRKEEKARQEMLQHEASGIDEADTGVLCRMSVRKRMRMKRKELKARAHAKH